MKKNLRKEILSGIKMIIIALVLGIGTSYIFAYTTWTAPTAVAPGNNVDAPLNVTATAQTKLGPLVVNGVNNTGTEGSIVPNGFAAFGQSIFQAFNPTGVTGIPVAVTIGTTSSPSTIQIVDGNQGAGKVLTSDANGNATWQPTPVNNVATVNDPLATISFVSSQIGSLQADQGKTYTVYNRYQSTDGCTDANDDRVWCYSNQTNDYAPTVIYNSSAQFGTIGNANGVWFRADTTTLGEICSVLFPQSPWPAAVSGAQYHSAGGHDYIYWDPKLNVWFHVSMVDGDGTPVMQGQTETCTSILTENAPKVSQ